MTTILLPTRFWFFITSVIGHQQPGALFQAWYHVIALWHYCTGAWKDVQQGLASCRADWAVQKHSLATPSTRNASRNAELGLARPMRRQATTQLSAHGAGKSSRTTKSGPLSRTETRVTAPTGSFSLLLAVLVDFCLEESLTRCSACILPCTSMHASGFMYVPCPGHALHHPTTQSSYIHTACAKSRSLISDQPSFFDFAASRNVTQEADTRTCSDDRVYSPQTTAPALLPNGVLDIQLSSAKHRQRPRGSEILSFLRYQDLLSSNSASLPKWIDVLV